jgi:isoleucyl-tRNA synthetase
VLDILFDTLVRWLAPVLAFTCDEAWTARHGTDECVHLHRFREVPLAWRDDALADKWARVRDIRRVITGALEIERREKRIGASLEARPTVHLGGEDLALVADLDMAELAITSGIELTDAPAPADAFRLEDVEGVAVVPALAGGERCARCWQQHDRLSAEGLCERCEAAVAAWRAAA